MTSPKETQLLLQPRPLWSHVRLPIALRTLHLLFLPQTLRYSRPPLLNWMHQWELAVPGLR